MYGDSVSGGFNAGDLQDRIHQSLPVMRARAAYKGAIDIEQYQIGQGYSIVSG
jgi:hypothetical protein